MELNGIEYEELAGSPTEALSDLGEASAKRLLKVAWNDRLDLAYSLLGDGDGPARQYPALRQARVAGISIRPMTDAINGGTVLNTYEHAILEVDYKVKQQEEAEQPESDEVAILEETIQNTVDSLNLPWRKLYWVKDEFEGEGSATVPLTEAEAPSKPIPKRRWTLAIYNVRTLPANLSSLSGCCNEGSLRSRTLGETFPAETVMFIGSEQSRQITSASVITGIAPWRLTLNFLIQPYSWNLFWRRGYDTPQPIYKEFDELYKPVTPVNFATAFGYSFS